MEENKLSPSNSEHANVSPTNHNTSLFSSIFSSPNKDIKIKPELIKENYDEDFVETLITTFVEKDYEEKKTNIEEAWKTRDAAKLYYNCHSFKTTARMLYIEDFALECQEILNCATVGKEDWNKLDQLVPLFLEDFKLIYEDACEIYDKEYKPKPVEILDDLPESEDENYNFDNLEIIDKNINQNENLSVSSMIDLGDDNIDFMEHKNSN